MSRMLRIPEMWRGVKERRRRGRERERETSDGWTLLALIPVLTGSAMEGKSLLILNDILSVTSIGERRK